MYSNSHVCNENPIIPEDIIRLEILTRLSVKSLMRFRCICKSWQSLISSDPVFIKSHHACSSIDTNDRLVVFRFYKHPDTCYPDESNHPLVWRDTMLAGSVNGIVCFYHNYGGNVVISGFEIWNPAIHQYKYVPPPSAYNVSHRPCIGFSFDPIENDYKVIHITHNDAMPLVADVYSCNADSWSNISVSSSFILEDGEISQHATNVNGILYRSYHKKGDYKTHFPVSFDTRAEVFTMFPSLDYLPAKYFALVNLKNSLAIIVYDFADVSYVDVFVLNQAMSSNGETLSKLYTVGPITLERNMEILQCSRDGELIFKNAEALKYVCIDPETHAIGSTSIHPFDSHFKIPAYTCAFGYTETLVSVMGMKQVKTDECVVTCQLHDFLLQKFFYLPQNQMLESLDPCRIELFSFLLHLESIDTELLQHQLLSPECLALH
ncbi:putative F-box protein At1g32420 [Apium graveolens]|uniref:putative F-box protein At1g32420 n=1 Tax=Apium graveolens TaxID=4045 RepID=UPI003D7A67CE